MSFDLSKVDVLVESMFEDYSNGKDEKVNLFLESMNKLQKKDSQLHEVVIMEVSDKWNRLALMAIKSKKKYGIPGFIKPQNSFWIKELGLFIEKKSQSLLKKNKKVHEIREIEFNEMLEIIEDGRLFLKEIKSNINSDYADKLVTNLYDFITYNFSGKINSEIHAFIFLSVILMETGDFIKDETKENIVRQLAKSWFFDKRVDKLTERLWKKNDEEKLKVEKEVLILYDLNDNDYKFANYILKKQNVTNVWFKVVEEIWLRNSLKSVGEKMVERFAIGVMKKNLEENIDLNNKMTKGTNKL